MAKKFLPIAEPIFGKEELSYVSDCVKSGWVSSKGKYITEFEKSFSRFVDTKYGVATSNGTTALHLVLATLGIKPGDEVIVPSLTFIATANVVKYCGAKAVFVDSESETWNIDTEKIESAITEKTKAIIPVHLYGHPADMDPILEIAKRKNLIVIEDAAEAHGAEYKGKKVGGIGDYNCFSFYGNKIITTGEGGMVTTNDDEFVEKAKTLRSHGMSAEKWYWHPYLGYNYRMTNLQAALGLAQMKKIKKFIGMKRKNAELYKKLLSEVDGITLQVEKSWAKSVYWMFGVLIEDEFGLDRDDLIQKLKKENMETRPFFYPVHTQPEYSRERIQLKVAEEVARKGIVLPSALSMGKADIQRVVETLEKIKRKK
ncbi:TPA: DegT/DnrJ/EryC1/StrS family aminotransferase [archaeon]|uniref:DegT/DnrJ/EryC1/StrS family aminotransferase n=1 Tax=Candidatus Naiadarchaeum limnaeum TaxID=2756139 RepID=A0A832V0M0_9ARCH|nr:DegT/DnrJ/EryC1/StrS family aminotransferase [Candidatus Naiadarchaeales archaeon SRR2090153.bin1042]HIK00694.1 DegT/DnrJ/EryC1/StrS family aminotransferase [Candidatus Naiadarchaeum limnaeum]